MQTWTLISPISHRTALSGRGKDASVWSRGRKSSLHQSRVTALVTSIGDQRLFAEGLQAAFHTILIILLGGFFCVHIVSLGLLPAQELRTD